MSDSASPSELLQLLKRIEISRIDERLAVPSSYSGFRTQALVRIHLLPYLLPIKSERALAFEVAERPELRRAVGLDAPTAPTRATLWHFRKRNLELFRRLIPRALALISLDATAAGLRVPFERLDRKPGLTTPAGNHCDEFTDREAGVSVKVCTSPVGSSSNQPHQIALELPDLPDSPQDPPYRVFLHEEIGFPIMVCWSDESQSVTRNLVQPEWMESPYATQDLTNLFGSAGKGHYTACNIIVLRQKEGEDQVLLSKRLMGSGKGKYALPGGKKDRDESVRECVIRELAEEVGLEFRGGRPVSIREENVPEFPPVCSIGVVATKWRGKPRNREHLAHSRWKWFNTSELPSPIFFPSKWALDDFLSDRFPDLTWDEIEDEVTLPLWRSHG